MKNIKQKLRAKDPRKMTDKELSDASLCIDLACSQHAHDQLEKIREIMESVYILNSYEESVMNEVMRRQHGRMSK